MNKTPSELYSRPVLGWMLFVCALGSAELHAQAPAPNEEIIELAAFTVSTESVDRYRANESISANRVRAPLQETASSISVMPRDLLDDIQPVRLYDATKYIAGVQEGRGITFADRQIIRGFESSGRTVDNFLDNTGINFPEVLVDRIEVSKGPNAILAPGGVPGGAINVITKSPSFKSQNSITALVGLFDAQRFTFDSTGGIGKGQTVAYRLIASRQDTERYWSHDAKLERTVIAPSFTWRLGNKTELTVKYSYDDSFIFREQLVIVDPSLNAASEPILGPGFHEKGLNGIDPWSGISMETNTLQFQSSTSFGDHFSMRFAGRTSYFHETSLQKLVTLPGFTNRYNPATGVFTMDYTWALNSSNQPVSTFSRYYDPSNIPTRAEQADGFNRQYALQNDWVARFAPKGIKLQTVAGWAATRNHTADKRYTLPLPAINLLNYTPVARPTTNGPLSGSSVNETFDWQVYVNQRAEFLNSRLILNGGILRFGTDSYSANRFTGAPGSKLEDSKDMYLGSILYKVIPSVSVYYSHSTNGTPTIANNQPLWRDGEQDEVGAKWETEGGRFAVNVAYFEMAQTNVSVPNPERLVNPTAPQSLISDQENYGYEIEVSGALTKNLSVFGSVSKLKLRDTLGRPIRAVADDTAAMMFNYKITKGSLSRLSFNLGAVYTGERAGDATPINFTSLGVVTKQAMILKSYVQVNAGASYSWDKYALRLFVDNLTDDKGFIQQAGSPIASGTAVGMNVRLSATLKF